LQIITLFRCTIEIGKRKRKNHPAPPVCVRGKSARRQGASCLFEKKVEKKFEKNRGEKCGVVRRVVSQYGTKMEKKAKKSP
jgi:hypothetical protein